MAKPGSSPTPWATNANYSTGPRVGTPTKVAVPAAVQVDGWLPAQKPPAQWENSWHNEVYLWLAWVNAGSAAAGEDAHIVETGANGDAAIARMTVGPHSAGGISLAVTGAPTTRASDFQGGAGQIAARFTAGTGAVAIEATGNGAFAGITAQGGTSGPGAQCTGGATGSNAGVVGSGTGAAPGCSGSNSGTGPGVSGTGGTNGSGVEGTGVGTAVGCKGTGGSGVGGHGVEGTAGEASAMGVKGVVAAAATTSAAGVQGIGTVNAMGVYGLAASGYGMVAESDTTTPARAAFRIVPQDTDPATSPLDGDVIYHSGEDTLKVRAAAVWRNVWHSQGGLVRGYFESLGLSSTSSTSMQTKVTGAITVRVAGDTVHVRVAFEMSSAASPGQFEFDIYDLTNAVTIKAARSVPNPSASANADQRDVVAEADYVLPSTAATTIELRYRSTGGVSASYIRGASMEITGSYPP